MIVSNMATARVESRLSVVWGYTPVTDRMKHGDRQGRHYYRTAPQANSFVCIVVATLAVAMHSMLLLARSVGRPQPFAHLLVCGRVDLTTRITLAENLHCGSLSRRRA